MQEKKDVRSKAACKREDPKPDTGVGTDASAGESTASDERLAHIYRVLLGIRNVNQLIVSEDDPCRLIEKACLNLTETMGYHNAWIALLGGEAARELGLPEAGAVTAAAAAGFDGGFEVLRERLERGDFPECMDRALETGESHVVDDPAVDCPECPLHSEYGGRAGLVRRLDFDGVTYGVLTASVPAAYARDAEEQDLFNEVADDLAFALHKIATARRLEESRQYLGLVIEGSGIGTWQWNVQTNTTVFNEQWAGMLGYTLEELTPYDYTTWKRLVHPEDLARTSEALTDCLEGRTTDYNCEFRMKHKDGRWVWILDQGRVMTRDDEGKALAMFGTHTDVTGIKQSEEALKREHTMLARTQAVAHVGSWEWEAEGDKVTWSDELFRIFGLEPADEAPPFAEHQAFYVPEDRDRLLKAVQKCMNTGAPYDLELRMTRSDGQLRHCVARGFPERDADGAAKGLYGSLHDITEIKRSEEALKKIEWMLTPKSTPADAGQTVHHEQDYGDLTELNRDGLILKSIGRERLKSFANDYLELLGTSSAIYEINGDYAFGIFASGWCRMMDCASRRLCETTDNVEALNSGRWLCHESCWTDCSKRAIAERAPADIECNGGIRIYAVPILAHEQVVGVINFGYGDPPTDPEQLRKLAETYHLDYDDLVREAAAYDARPPFIIELAKKRLHATARLIGSMIETKQANQALRESESRVRAKLNALLDPEGDLETLNLSDVVDCDQIQSLMDDFYALTEIGVGIVDLDGTILVAAGYQDICTEFHRVHPETARNCIESDTLLTSGVEPGTFKVYKCKNNMWDMVTPIMIGERHLGNLFLGQFLFDDEEPDLDVFREQARRYGFDEGAYLEAYRGIPRWSRQTVDQVMAFYCNLIGVISSLSYARIKLARTSEELRKSEGKFRALIDNTIDWIWQCDANGRYTYVSENTHEILGYTREELLGRTPFDLMDNKEANRVRSIFKEIVQKHRRIVALEDTLLHRNGHPLVFETNATPLIDDNGDLLGFFGTCRDMTEAKQAEEALRESERRFQRMLSVVPDMISIHSPEMDILYSNWQGFAAVPEDHRLVNTKCYMTYRGLDGICPDCRAGVVLETGRPFNEEVQLPDGRWIDLRVIPLLDKDDNVEMFMEWVRDITEHKQAEQEHQRLSTQLTQAQKMESVGRLAGGVAHDFNNMLNVILGHSELMLYDLPDDSPLCDGLDEIRKAAERSANLTRQLLAFARKQTVAPKVVDLNETIASMLKMLERLIGEDIDLLWRPGGRLSPIRIDPGQVDQMLANLVVNARDAIGRANGKITIETAPACLDEEYCASHPGFLPGDYVMLAVSDDGCGMDEETRGNIFEPFFTTKGVGEGTGLGLATIYGIVKQNDGFVNVYSEPGKGTTFRIYLPAMETAYPDADSVSRSDATPTGGDETILIVEDEAAILNLARTMLESLGYTVLTASVPGDALRVAGEWDCRIDLLITDVVMPEMNGLALSQKLQALCPGLKSLFMSGYTANVIAHHSVLDEGVDFVQKPFLTKDFCRKVREVLDK